MLMTMEPGRIVEYIDHEKIVCAVVTEAKNLRLRLLTDHNREVKLSVNRLTHKKGAHLDVSMGRDKLVAEVKATAQRRQALIAGVDIKELWEVLNSEQEWIDLVTMTAFCFPENVTADHESAVIRAFFGDRLYFKFSPDRFFPNSEDRVAQITARLEAEAKKNRIIEEGGKWLAGFTRDPNLKMPEVATQGQREVVAILKSVFLKAKESPHYAVGKALLAKVGIKYTEGAFELLVKLGAWSETENIDLYRLEIPVAFTDEVAAQADELVKKNTEAIEAARAETVRKDLTSLSLMTIDGQATLDFDDALSIEKDGDQYRLGVHIADVAHFIKRWDLIDQEAMARASSIYMPDNKIPMIPASLAEGLCSLKAGELRPAISILARISPNFDLIDYEVIPSLVRVKNQYTYFDVNTVADKDPEIVALHAIAKRFREFRMAQNAVQITLPEVNVWINSDGTPGVSHVNRESPSRMLVAELMIMANWLMAKFLADHDMPAVFRTQPEPKQRLYKGDGGSVFQNWMQRKLLSRFVLGITPQPHSGLGLEAYVTATSPIRKYFDLTTQRQIRAIFDLEQPATESAVDRVIQIIGSSMTSISRLQFGRSRFWLLKYLETQVGKKEEALVLSERRNHFIVLLKAYMMECSLAKSGGIKLSPESLVQVTIQNVNARRDVVTVFLS
jgi:exoribonuclease II